MRTTFKTTNDLLSQLRLFHKNLSNFYDQLSNEVERPRVQLLLEYVSGHTKRLEESLAKYQLDAPEEVLDTWFQYLPELESLDGDLNMTIRPDMSVDMAVQVVVSFMEKLANIYRHLAERSLNAQVSDLFNQLLEYEEKDKRQFVTDAAMMGDI